MKTQPTIRFQRTHFRNGQVHTEEPFLKAQLHGAYRSWHKNGRPASIEPHADGLPHGLATHWNSRGRKLGTYRLKNGTGVVRDWDDSGTLRSEISVVDGLFTGRSRTWLADGTLASERFFIQNRTVSRTHYAKACEADASLPRFVHDGKRPAREGAALDRKRFALFVSGQLSLPSSVPALGWLESRKGKARRFLGLLPTEAAAVRFVTKVIDAGATEVIAADTYSDKKGNHYCDTLFVGLPREKKARTAVRAACESLPKKLRVVVLQETDQGETHLFLSMA